MRFLKNPWTLATVVVAMVAIGAIVRPSPQDRPPPHQRAAITQPRPQPATTPASNRHGNVRITHGTPYAVEGEVVMVPGQGKQFACTVELLYQTTMATRFTTQGCTGTLGKRISERDFADRWNRQGYLSKRQLSCQRIGFVVQRQASTVSLAGLIKAAKRSGCRSFLISLADPYAVSQAPRPTPADPTLQPEPLTGPVA